MKILLTNHDLAQFGGTQTWVHQMARTLTAGGHDVDVFCFVTDDHPMAEAVKGACRTLYVGQQPPDDYDLALINHSTCMNHLRPLSACKIYTQHGPAHWVEQYNHGADAVVAVSDEVAGVIKERHGLDATVIPNTVDVSVFQACRWRDLDDCPAPRLLGLCKGRRAHDMLEAACDRLGWEYRGIHYKTNGTHEIPRAIWDTHFVAGYGRAILEAMAVARPAFVFDARGKETPRADGWVELHNVDRLARTNFSGRANNIDGTIGWLVDTLEAGPTEQPVAPIHLVRWLHRTGRTADQGAHRYLDLYHSLTAHQPKDIPDGQTDRA